MSILHMMKQPSESQAKQNVYRRTGRKTYVVPSEGIHKGLKNTIHSIPYIPVPYA